MTEILRDISATLCSAITSQLEDEHNQKLKSYFGHTTQGYSSFFKANSLIVSDFLADHNQSCLLIKAPSRRHMVEATMAAGLSMALDNLTIQSNAIIYNVGDSFVRIEDERLYRYQGRQDDGTHILVETNIRGKRPPETRNPTDRHLANNYIPVNMAVVGQGGHLNLDNEFNNLIGMLGGQSGSAQDLNKHLVVGPDLDLYRKNAGLKKIELPYRIYREGDIRGYHLIKGVDGFNNHGNEEVVVLVWGPNFQKQLNDPIFQALEREGLITKLIIVTEDMGFNREGCQTVKWPPAIASYLSVERAPEIQVTGVGYTNGAQPLNAFLQGLPQLNNLGNDTKNGLKRLLANTVSYYYHPRHRERHENSYWYQLLLAKWQEARDNQGDDGAGGQNLENLENQLREAADTRHYLEKDGVFENLRRLPQRAQYRFIWSKSSLHQADEFKGIETIKLSDTCGLPDGVSTVYFPSPLIDGKQPYLAVEWLFAQGINTHFYCYPYEKEYVINAKLNILYQMQWDKWLPEGLSLADKIKQDDKDRIQTVIDQRITKLSSDRMQITSLDDPNVPQAEANDRAPSLETLLRSISLDIDTQRMAYQRPEPESYTVTIDNTPYPLRNCRGVLCCTENNHWRWKALSALKVGDSIACYYNNNEESMIHLIDDQNRTEEITTILNASAEWKAILNDVWQEKRTSNRRRTAEAVRRHFGLEVGVQTIINYQYDEDKLFPGRDQDETIAILTAIVKNPTRAQEMAQLSQSAKSRSIRLGHALSDEVEEYIRTEQKGPILSQLRPDTHINNFCLMGEITAAPVIIP